MALLSRQFYVLLVFRCSRTHAASLRVARVINISLPPARDRHARGGGGGARSLTRSRARSVALAMTVAVAVGYAARHAYQAPFVTHAHACVITARRAPHQHSPAREDRSSRARSACARCGGGGARSLTRLRARGVAVAMAVAVVVGYVSRHAHHAWRVSRARAMSPLRVARVINFPFPRNIDARGGGGGGARSLARSITRTRCVAVAIAVAVAVGYATGHARHAICASHAFTRVSSPRVARVINVSLFARARSARACCGGGARSIARSIARTRCGVGFICHSPISPRSPAAEASRGQAGAALSGCFSALRPPESPDLRPRSPCPKPTR